MNDELMIILLGLALVAGLGTSFGRHFLVGFFIGLFPALARIIRNALLIRRATKALDKKR